MKILTIPLPETADEQDIKMQLGANLYQRGILSSGQAADLVGISKRKFIEDLGKYGVSIFGETLEDLEKIIHG